MQVTVWLDDEERQSASITKYSLFQNDLALVLIGSEITGGKHRIELKKEGKGRLYANTYRTNCTLEDNIEAAGLEVKIARKYYKLVPTDRNNITPGVFG